MKRDYCRIGCLREVWIWRGVHQWAQGKALHTLYHMYCI